MTDKPLRALVIEDCESNVDQVLRSLHRSGFSPTHRRVDTAFELEKALDDGPWDVVLANHSMPQLTGLDALSIIQDREIDVPFIVVSGTTGEDDAVETMRAGAHDYLLMGLLERLGPAIEREMRRAQARQDHADGVDEISHLNRVLFAVRNVNQLIIREKDDRNLLENAAKLLVENQGYTSALLTRINGTDKPAFTSYRVAGKELNGTNGKPVLPRGLTDCMRTALNTTDTLVISSDAPECASCPVRRSHSGRVRMFRGLSHQEQRYGVATVALPPGLRATDGEIDLFDEVADDLGFALHGIAQGKELIAERGLAEASIDAMTDTFFVFDVETHKLLRWNAAFRKTSGYSDKEIAAMSGPADFYSEEDLSKILAALQQIIEHGEGSVVAELITKDGTKIPTEYLGTRIPGEPGSKVSIIVIGRDITERRMMRTQIAQANRLASMGMLAAGVAHEINNPLSYVLYNLQSLALDLPELAAAMQAGLAHIIERSGDNTLEEKLDLKMFDPARLEDIGSRLDDALQGANRIRQVTRGLGTFARVDKDRVVPIDLVPVIEVVINMVFNEIKYRARLVKDFGKTSPVMANDGRLSQVFMNLLVNAAHAIDEGNVAENEIRIRTWQEGEHVFTEIRDTGKGIPQSQVEQVFDPFFTTKELGIGTGLGLSISQSIIHAYGGSIEVHSKLGEGTSFIVRMPAGQMEHVGQHRQTEERRPPEHKGRVLIVDDEVAILAAMQRMLRGHDVVAADNGESAKRILEEDRDFDLILCDLMMPKVSGMDLHQWLESGSPELAGKVVFITGGAFTPRAIEYLKNANIARLEKPFDVDKFTDITNRQIQLSRQATE